VAVRKQIANPSPALRAALYLRVSTDEQRERQSIETQRQFATAYCETNHIDVADCYADDGISGTVPLGHREQGARLLEDARQGRFEEVLVYKLDRLGRDPRMILDAVAELAASGARLRSMTEPFDTKDPSGRFMLTVLSGVAGFERDNIIQRSIEGTNRLAREGAWLGGIVPYGYTVEGKKRDARLVVAEEPIPGSPYSEAGVVRRIYELAGKEGKSCMYIAERLNQVGISPDYTRDGRAVRVGKRQRVTTGIWRAGRVRNLLVNTTYKGIHQYGKRSKSKKAVIERPVPPIVDEALWQKAQETLHRNLRFSDRNARRKYLLRGLIKCGVCGHRYIGTAYRVGKHGERVYYACNGKQSGRGNYAVNGPKCPSKSLTGNIEQLVWRDIEGFIRNPGPVLDQLEKRMKGLGGSPKSHKEDLAETTKVMRAKSAERDRVLALYRRGRIDDRTLDKQMDEIGAEEKALQERVRQLTAEAEGTRTMEAQIQSTGDLLRELNRRLDEPVTWELKRQLVELLVEEVRADTIESDGKPDSRVTVTYRFPTSAAPVTPGTDARSDTRPSSCRCSFRSARSAPASRAR
jgi:site-specific DNA recombinase